MPKVNSYAPAWLCRPSPGAKFLSSNSTQSPALDPQDASKSSAGLRPTRSIAKRGNEVFAVVDNEIRWSNLVRLKDQWQQQVKQKNASAGQASEKLDSAENIPYRVRTQKYLGYGTITSNVIANVLAGTARACLWVD